MSQQRFLPVVKQKMIQWLGWLLHIPVITMDRAMPFRLVTRKGKEPVLKPSIKHTLLAIGYSAPYHIGSILSFGIAYLLLTVLWVWVYFLGLDFYKSVLNQDQIQLFFVLLLVVVIIVSSIESTLLFVIACSILTIVWIGIYVIGSVFYISGSNQDRILIYFVLLFVAIITTSSTISLHVKTFFWSTPSGFIVQLRQGQLLEFQELLSEVVRELGRKPPDNIFLLPGPQAWAFERRLIPLLTSKKRNLGIGWPLITSLSRQELKAVIAHELAHFDNNAMSLHQSIYNTRQAILNTRDRLIWWEIQGENAYLRYPHPFNMVISFSSGLMRIGFFVYRLWLDPFYRYLDSRSKSISHEAEYYCDKVSAEHFGANSVSNALSYTAIASEAFINLIRSQERVKKAKNCYSLFYEHYDAVRQKTSPNRIKHLIKETDTHPSLQDRVRNLENIPSTQYPSHPLIPQDNHYYEIEEELTKKIQEMVAGSHHFTQLSNYIECNTCNNTDLVAIFMDHRFRCPRCGSVVIVPPHEQFTRVLLNIKNSIQTLVIRFVTIILIASLLMIPISILILAKVEEPGVKRWAKRGLVISFIWLLVLITFFSLLFPR